MSNAIDPAFPYPDHGDIGLTKRELFAAMALQGLCADPERVAAHSAYAQDAVMMADALLAELNKETQP